jgi:hypothetical protein
MSPGDVLGQLVDALKSIYYTAGREVVYETDAGEIRPYWPRRYWQALKRAIADDEVVEFVERVVTRDHPTRGFGYLEDLGRLDLTVEALVVDTSKPFHALFSKDAVERSRQRLAQGQARLAAVQVGRTNEVHVDYVDKPVQFEIDLPQSVMSVDRAPVRVAAGRYDVSVMRHWAARLDEGGLRAGDLWYFVGMPDRQGVWIRAVECAIRS